MFKDIEYLGDLHLEFRDELELPDWFGELKADEIIIDGVFTSKYVRQLKKLFKDRKVSVKRRGNTAKVFINARKSFDPGNIPYTRRTIYGDWVYMEAEIGNGYRYFDEYVEKNRRIAVSKDNYVNADAEKVRDGNCILVDFTIELDGSITDVKIHENENLRKECRDEVERLIKEMPKWNPATRGEAGTVRYRALEKVRF